MVFRIISRWPTTGEKGREVDYQIGAAQQWEV